MSTTGQNAGLQQRKNESSTSDAPASLSADPKKKVPQNKPAVKPPFQNTSMNKFMSNLMLLVVAVLAFYLWRVTVWASDAGGYWNLLTGAGSSPNGKAAAARSASAEVEASLSASSSIGSKQAKITPRPTAAGTTPDEDIQSQIYHLASSLGIKPADLSAAIRPLIDPTVPNPAEEARRIKEQLELKVQMEGHKEEAKKEEEGSKGPGIIEVLEEAFLD